MVALAPSVSALSGTCGRGAGRTSGAGGVVVVVMVVVWDVEGRGPASKSGSCALGVTCRRKDLMSNSAVCSFLLT